MLPELGVFFGERRRSGVGLDRVGGHSAGGDAAEHGDAAEQLGVAGLDQARGLGRVGPRGRSHGLEELEAQRGEYRLVGGDVCGPATA